jgi:hypothetical protein
MRSSERLRFHDSIFGRLFGWSRHHFDSTSGPGFRERDFHWDGVLASVGGQRFGDGKHRHQNYSPPYFMTWDIQSISFAPLDGRVFRSVRCLSVSV